MKKLFFSMLSILLCFNFSECQAQYGSSKELPETLLLKNWQPESIYVVPKTHIEKAKFPVIDMHAHDYSRTAEDVAKRAHYLDEVGVKSVVFSGTGKEFSSAYALYSKYPDKFLVFCGIDFQGYQQKGWSEKAAKEIEEDVKKGALGIGEIVDKGSGLNSARLNAPGMHADDPRMDLIWETCAKLGISVNLHMSDPMWMYKPMDSTNDGLMRSWTWRIKKEDRVIDHEGIMKILENTLKKHPNTIFVAAHLANCTYNLAELGKLFDNYPNLYADIGARFSEFSSIPRFAAKFFDKYQDRIVYGTDYGWEVWKPYSPYGQKEPDLAQMYRMTFRVLETQDEHFYMTALLGYKWPLYGLGLSDSVLKKIYHDNAFKILNMRK